MENPYLDQNNEQASEALRLSLAFLSKNQVPPSPLNYRLAYDYVSGRNREMETVLEEAVSKLDSEKQELLWEIYKRFFIQDNTALEKLRNDLRLVISGIQSEFKQSGGELNNFSTQLEQFSSVLNTQGSTADISAEVQKMIAGTNSMAKTQNSLDAKMTYMQDEVESLRKELEQIKEESLTDALTGIANRKAFDETLDKSITEAKEQSSALSMLLIDIDHFKKFNDTFGHLVGDKVLRYVGSSLKNCVKGQDFPARYGGEEFSVILPHTSHIGAKVIAEQIRKTISAKELKDKAKNKNFGKITASIGVAEFAEDETAETFIQRCDKALYKAKENGRNRVMIG